MDAERTTHEVDPHRVWEVRLGGEVVGFVGYVQPGRWQALDAEGEPIGLPVYETLDAAADRVAYDQAQAFAFAEETP